MILIKRINMVNLTKINLKNQKQITILIGMQKIENIK